MVRSEAALRSVLEATRSAQEALDAVDLEALEAAVALRGDALQELREQLAGDGSARPDPALVEEVLAADGRLRASAGRCAKGLRDRIVGLGAGRRGLALYAARGRPEPRFADHRG